MDMSRRVMSWLAVLSTCCVVWAVSSFAGLPERPAHTVELASTKSESSVSTLSDRQVSGERTEVEHAAPEKAYDLLEALQRRNGEPLPGYAGGKDFQNRERRLPHGRYKEYDVNRRIPGRSRGAERLVIEQDTGKAYYTDDHYRTFVPLN
jgi:guanyl-specific ribonuclease Sa